MTSRLLLTVALWASSVSSDGSKGPSLQVRCRAFRYPVAVDCSWTQPPAPSSSRPTSFVATYRLGVAAQGESQPCLQPTPGTPSCAISDFQMFSMVPYVLNVTAVQSGSVSSTLLPFVPERIIKSDPPEAVRLSPVSGKQLRVQWEPPQTWPFPKVFTLKYWIRYKRHGSAHFRQVGPTEDTTFTFRAVRPQGRYCVQVCAQDLLGYGDPSDWSPPATLLITPSK